MPVIPTTKGPQVARGVFQAPKVSTSSPLIGATPELGAVVGASKEILAIREKAKKDSDNIAFGEAKNDAREFKSNLLYNKESGYLTTTRGKASMEDFNVHKDPWDKFKSERLAKVSDPKLRARVAQSYDSMSIDLDRSMNTHASREFRTYDNAQTKRQLDNINDETITAAEVADIGAIQVDNALAEQRAVILEYAERNGLEPDEIQEQVLDQSTQLHAGMIENSLNKGNDLAAKRYFNEAKKRKEIDRETIEVLEKKINGASVLGASQRIVADVASRDLGWQESVDLAREMGGKISPEAQATAVSNMKNRMTEKTRGEKYSNEAQFNVLAQELRQTGQIPMGEAGTLSGRQQSILKKLAELKAKGVSTQTDPLIEQELLRQSANPVTRNAFMQRDLSLNMIDLSDADYTKFLNQQRALREDYNSQDVEYGRIFGNTKVVDNVMKELKISSDKKKAQFSSKVMIAAEQWKIDNQKKKISNEDLDRIARDMGKEVKVEGLVFDSNKMAFELKEGDVIIRDEAGKKLIQAPRPSTIARPTETPSSVGTPISASYNSIDPATRQRIENSLKTHNQPVTEKKVVEIYKIQKNRKGS